MVNDIQTAEKNFLENPQSLNSAIVKKYLDPKGTATDEELAYFIAQAKTQNLNPFTKEIYFIKYGSQPAQVVVALKAFQKKADAHPQYDGMGSGIIYEKSGEEIEAEGAFVPRGAEIVGGWATVYRKDRSHPTKVRVTFSEYDNSKIRARVKELEKNGNTVTYPVMNAYNKPIGENNWDSMPAVMIRKVAIVTALREAFPNELGGNYEIDELRGMKDVTPNDVQVESQEEVKARKMKEIESNNKKQAATVIDKQQPDLFQASEPISDEDLPFTV
ncbi:phage recombination protein Bet [Streptococcus porcinus]|uniref:phage recombination protein Bet n=1 Tax=Streptococcus porcinus TaxID=1340 RepID=UPI0010CAD11C|nr:phage recombination protein Bet [Streptococcus porcinus]VTS33100.1 phage recombination protein Bet [Streptococcus porcinus]